MSENEESDDKAKTTTDLGEDFLQRLARWASGNFTRLPWPKNIISILCAETLNTREEIAALKKRCDKLHSDIASSEARLQSWKRKIGAP